MSQMPSTTTAVDTAMTDAKSTVAAQPTVVNEPDTAANPAPTGSQTPRTNPDQHPHHVIFVVHGMGRQLEEFGNYERNVSYLVENIKSVLQSQFHHLKTDVHIIPVEWHAKLHNMVDQRMALATLRTVPKVRLVMNDYFSDILYYFNNHFGSEIVRIIVDELNEAYSTFKTKHPDFNGKIAVYALSLGGIAMFDILTCMDDDEPEDGNNEQESRTSRSAPHEAADHEGDPRSTESRGETLSASKKARVRKQDQSKFRAVIPKLKFRPHILFTVGSPVGAVMVMRNLEWDLFHPPDDILHHNIFHPFDPLAYRIEPLIDPIFAAIPAVTLTSTGNSQLFPISLPSLLPSLPESLSSFWETKVPALPIPSIPKLSTLSQMTQSLKTGRWIPGVGGSGGLSGQSSEDGALIEKQDQADYDGIMRNGSGDERAGEGHQHQNRDGQLYSGTTGQERYYSATVGTGVSITEAIAAATVVTYLDQKGGGSTDAGPPNTRNLTLDCDIGSTTTGSPYIPTSPSKRRPSLGPRRISSRVEDEDKAYNYSGATKVEQDDLMSTTTQATLSTSKSRATENSRQGNTQSVLSGQEQPYHTHIIDKGLKGEFGLEDIQAAHMEHERLKQDERAKRVMSERVDEHQEDPSAHKKNSVHNNVEDEKPKPEDVDTIQSPIHVRGRATKVPYRIDHVLQETRVDQYTNEYLLGMRSHFRYWGNRDIAYHILKTILRSGGGTEDQVLNLEPEMPAPVTASKGAKEAAEAKAKAAAEAYRQNQGLGHRKSFSFSFIRGQTGHDKNQSSMVGTDVKDEDAYDNKSRVRWFDRNDTGSLSGSRFMDLDMSSAADVPSNTNTLYQNSPFVKRGSAYSTSASRHSYQASSNGSVHRSESHGGHLNNQPYHQRAISTPFEKDAVDESSSSPTSAPIGEGFVIPDLAKPPRLHHRTSRVE
ncbi:MAG: hypothetical protein J3Q66DRAFT_355071 [Benniella sp.]|nr:MAG: hypothetical protein J3Q66DRAFT_355071 [Benniella sp.]